MRVFALLVVLAILVAARFAGAQFNGDGVMVPVKRASLTLASPISFSPASVTVADNCCAAAGTTLTAIAVTMSDGSTFAGQCYDTDPNGLTQILPSAGGCTLQSKIAYSSANDGTYSNITLNFCNGGTNCLNPGSANFTLVINSSAIPAPANAGCLPSNGGSQTNGSCFKTLAMNMDFTGATQSFVGTIGPFSATTLSNWLDCAGAATPAMYAQGFGHPSPGCFYSIVSDAGSTSLKMSDPMGDTNGMELETANSSRTVGTAFPGQFYVEAMLRTDATSNAACPSGTPCTDFWSYASYGGSPVIEYDFIEMYNGNTDTGGANAISPSSYTLEQHSFAAASIPGYSNLANNIVGERITQDGAGKQSYCFYYNNVQVNAETYISPLTGNCGVRGPDNSILANLATPVNIILQALGATNGTISSYFKWVHVWTCPNWEQAQQPTNNGWACTGVLLSSNP